ncbi:hypothetical protein MATL_G00237130 [Megalops atlanticus]|uniref:Occludin n=1 Tax=Megalops atlanticus TaxID=7932 RepID=A0A9D3T0Y1_MEGAT|nr:hypothetical protein MATL_G00237130 [Megalops atlanticus]
MYESRYDSPPSYSAPYRSRSDVFSPSGSFHPSRGGFALPQPAPASLHEGGMPQHFYGWLSPPGIVRIMQGVIVLLCFVVFICVSSALVWDMGYDWGMGGNSPGFGGSGFGGGFGTGGSYGSGYYGGGYGYYSSYLTPYSGKASMISMAAINFLASSAFLAVSFSKTSRARGRRFYLAVLAADIVLAVLQAIIDVVFIVGVNPMSQGSQNMVHNPMLVMCQNLDGNNFWEGAGGVGGFPMYNQYLFNYCYMDAQEIVAMVCGLLIVVALAVAAYFSHKTRSKIWRHGNANIYWDEPLTGGLTGGGLDWVNTVESGRSIHDAPTLVMSEKPVPLLNAANSVVSYPVESDAILSEKAYPDPEYTERSVSSRAWSSPQGGGAGRVKPKQADREWKPSARRVKRRGLSSQGEESQNETGYTTGGDTGTELDLDQWRSVYPEITSDAQRQEYKREFDSDLRRYKRLCAEMDDINDQMNKLSRELDELPEGTTRYQAVADEFNRLKDLKRTADYQTKKLQCRELRQKLFHIKQQVKTYDRERV